MSPIETISIETVAKIPGADFSQIKAVLGTEACVNGISYLLKNREILDAKDFITLITINATGWADNYSHHLYPGKKIVAFEVEPDLVIPISDAEDDELSITVTLAGLEEWLSSQETEEAELETQ